MRKSIAVLLAVFLAGTGAFCFISNGIKAEEEQVQYVSVEETGDAQAADGLSVSMNASVNRLAKWKIQNVFQNGIQTESDFSFGNGKEEMAYQTPKYYLDQGAYVNFYSGGGITGGDVLQKDYGWYSPYLPIFRELAKEIPEDGQREFTVRLKDYMEYHPISVEPEYSESVVTNGNTERGIDILNWNMKEEKTYTDISSILQIPVQKDQQMQVTMQKEGDTVYDLSFDLNTFVEDRDVSVQVYNCITYDGMLIAVDYRLSEGDGMKVFWIPLTELASTTQSWQDEQGNQKTIPVFGPDYQAAKLIYEETAGQLSVNLLTATEDGTEFVMMYQVDRMGRVVRFDSKDGTILQNDPTGLEVCYNYFREGDAVIGIEDQVAVFEKDSNGDYQTVLLTEDQTDGEYLLDPEFAWDGERLAVVTAFDEDENQYPYRSYGTSFKLYVYGREALLYKGDYICTLDDGHFAESYDTIIARDNMDIKWEQ